MTKPLFTVRTHLLAAVAKWACQDDTRWHLNNVLFDGKHMVATDGHRLVVVTCETGLSAFTLHRLDIAALSAAQGAIDKRRRAELGFTALTTRGEPPTDGRIDVDLGVGGRALSMTVKTGDAKEFPPWEKLFESLKAETPAPPSYSFEPRFLADMDEVIKSVTGDVQRTITVKAWTAVEPGGYVGPMLFESVVFDDGPGGYEMRFLIMPKRS